MSSILYNTNSSLIQKFQRNESLATSSQSVRRLQREVDPVRHNVEPLGVDQPFQSESPRDSPEYLGELCCSVYPRSLHCRIEGLELGGTLEAHALIALILKSFVFSWYGTKIPTHNDEFHVLLFDLFDTFTQFIAEGQETVPWEQLIFDDFPLILSQHIDTLRRLRTLYPHSAQEHAKLYKQTCFIEDGRYPRIFVELLKGSLRGHKSQLQESFLDSLCTNVIFGRVFDSISESYYVVRLMTKVSDLLLAKKTKDTSKVRYGSVVFLLRMYRSAKVLVSSILLHAREKRAISTPTPIQDRYFSTLLLEDILILPVKAPLLYFLLKCVHRAVARVHLLKSLVSSVAYKYIHRRLLTRHVVATGINKIRELLFPNDNEMGPRTVIPTGDEFEVIKQVCADKMWNVLQLYHISGPCGITRVDVTTFVEMVCQEDKSCNKILIFRLLDCTLAYILDNPTD
ncbi:Nvj3p KNAG_0A04780 [Huiozyma naganishii CBS 8797]|uniref:PXA domain-containing protein n=1 Tax=Huiozyma naganishii (strain ATCC MYA-139 / BCRC 22969 / CBS 8797 / KCTC 17520 / NBRC 10181 / NCYC 3082 / Yp74L-3) TaxID=1071383 RepID=J7RF13_HUIN7|nr:hypothetical protein KNAG_0A04780 [Kazachstania naganishii CBS 8797]CCK68148.1 hypothetical protein KNAG_0A04780 [Kazachstania naganishii CBS 8797]